MERRALLEALAARDRHARALGIELAEVDEAQVVLRLRLTEAHTNFSGSGHGGVIFSLADSAFGLAANAHGRISLAIDTHMTFSTAVYPGDELVATAIELTRGRRSGTYRVEVRTGDGTLVSQLTGTAYVTDKPVPEAG